MEREQMDGEPLFERVLSSLDDTRRAAAALGEVVRAGDVLALVGELGAGKTTFVQALARGLKIGASAYVRSPTFTLIHEHDGRLPLYHIDLYRIDDPDELENLGLDEYLEGQGVCAVEWFDKFPQAWTEQTVEVRLEFVSGSEISRRVSMSGMGSRARELAADWESRLGGG
jgi:tRNA threonylcarbamoyladenosine biosynthesis protein TsaE